MTGRMSEPGRAGQSRAEEGQKKGREWQRRAEEGMRNEGMNQ